MCGTATKTAWPSTESGNDGSTLVHGSGSIVRLNRALMAMSPAQSPLCFGCLRTGVLEFLVFDGASFFYEVTEKVENPYHM